MSKHCNHDYCDYPAGECNGACLAPTSPPPVVMLPPAFTVPARQTTAGKMQQMEKEYQELYAVSQKLLDLLKEARPHVAASNYPVLGGLLEGIDEVIARAEEEAKE